MQRKILLFFLKALLFCNRYNSASSKALVGSGIRSAEEGEFPSVVCIATTDPPNSHPNSIVICTGVLISSTHILSAEHCVQDDTEAFEIIVGSIDLHVGVRLHPMWWLTYDWWATIAGNTIENQLNDIAIIRVLNNAPESISPAIVTFQPNEAYYGFEVVLAGWGTSGDGASPRILDTVKVRIISNQDCEQLAFTLEGKRSLVPMKYMCSIRQPYAFLSDGDSGGPVFLRNNLIGISEGTCPSMGHIFHSGKANVHNSIYYYRTFIIQSMHM